LTGTPLQNNLQELWSLLHWLYPELFTLATEKKFADSFDLTKGQYDVKFLEAARGLLKLIMLRRTKQVVDLSIPPREEMVVYLRKS
jgi:SWI/SNF-related matrix-associated actin-dependent regulator of chromatin subfamily A member 5